MALGFSMETFASSPLVRTTQLFLSDASTNIDNESDDEDDNDSRVYSCDPSLTRPTSGLGAGISPV